MQGTKVAHNISKTKVPIILASFYVCICTAIFLVVLFCDDKSCTLFSSSSGTNALLGLAAAFFKGTSSYTSFAGLGQNTMFVFSGGFFSINGLLMTLSNGTPYVVFLGLSLYEVGFGAILFYFLLLSYGNVRESPFLSFLFYLFGLISLLFLDYSVGTISFLIPLLFVLHSDSFAKFHGDHNFLFVTIDIAVLTLLGLVSFICLVLTWLSIFWVSFRKQTLQKTVVFKDIMPFVTTFVISALLSLFVWVPIYISCFAYFSFSISAFFAIFCYFLLYAVLSFLLLILCQPNKKSVILAACFLLFAFLFYAFESVVTQLSLCHMYFVFLFCCLLINIDYPEDSKRQLIGLAIALLPFLLSFVYVRLGPVKIPLSFLLLLFSFFQITKKTAKNPFSPVLPAIKMNGAVAAFFLAFMGLASSLVISVLAPSIKSFDQLSKDEKAFFASDGTSYRILSNKKIDGFFGTINSHSLLSPQYSSVSFNETDKLLKSFGFDFATNTYSTITAQSFLGVKYFYGFGNSNVVSQKIDGFEDIQINKYAFPIAFLSRSDLTDLSQESDPFVFQNELLYKTSDVEQPIFTSHDFSSSFDGSYIFSGASESLYLRLNQPAPFNVSLYLNGLKIKSINKGDSPIISLNQNCRSNSNSLYFVNDSSLEKKAFSFSLMKEDLNVLSTCRAAVKEVVLKDSTSPSKYEAEDVWNSGYGEYCVFTIPYSGHLKARLANKKLECNNAAGLLSFKITNGVSQGLIVKWDNSDWRGAFAFLFAGIDLCIFASFLRFSRWHDDFI